MTDTEMPGPTSEQDAYVVPVRLTRSQLMEICSVAGIPSGRSAQRDPAGSQRPNIEPISLAPAELAAEQRAIAVAKTLLGMTRRRMRIFKMQYVDDPSWHILLDLFVNGYEGRPVSVSSACIAACAPATTALRHITNFTELGVIERVPDPQDSRRVFVRLSNETHTLMVSALDCQA